MILIYNWGISWRAMLVPSKRAAANLKAISLIFFIGVAIVVQRLAECSSPVVHLCPEGLM